MKRYHAISFLLILNTFLCHAQFDSGHVELSLMGTGGYQRQTPATLANDSQFLGYAMLNLSVGYYFISGLSVEPQIGFVAIEKSFPSQSTLLNISYTRLIPSSTVALFARVGYGISNSLSPPMLAFVPTRISNKWDVHVLNAGAGTKILIKENVVLRLELNYRKESFQYQIPIGLYYVDNKAVELTKGEDFTNSYVGMLFGFSFIL